MTPTPEPDFPRYQADDFEGTPAGPCDLILEGGVASGAVHPYVVLELAQRHNLHSIGATSAGANAGVLAAAAEYARTVRGDPAGYVRFQEVCDARAGALGELFQEEPGFEPLMALFKGRGGLLSRALAGFRRPLLAGGLAGAAAGIVLAFAGWEWPASTAEILAAFVIVPGGAFLGALAAAGLTALRLRRRLDARLGICTGLTRYGAKETAITDWLHESIQHIAFGGAPGKVLTFGDLEGHPRRKVRLRLVASNLSQQKPHTLPETWPEEGRYRPAEWARLFPPAIMAHLKACTRDTGSGTRSLPSRADLPILVASRMSMSVPVLFEPVPVELPDVETARRVQELSGRPGAPPLPPSWLRVLFSDGGFTSNFPIHLFDAPLPAWPTYAVDFESLPTGAGGGSRVLVLDGETGVRIHDVQSAAGFVGAMLDTSRNWNDLLLSLLPIHRDRIARVHLAPGEGGLNLSMTRAEVRALMSYGLEAGRKLAQTSFPDHQVRRARSLYAGLLQVSRQARRVWTAGGLGGAFRAGQLPAQGLTARDRGRIATAIDTLSAIAGLPRASKAVVPAPEGQTRITARY